MVCVYTAARKLNEKGPAVTVLAAPIGARVTALLVGGLP
jgi:hypothetical protein